MMDDVSKPTAAYLSGSAVGDLMDIGGLLEKINAEYRDLKFLVRTGQIRWWHVYGLRREVNKLSRELSQAITALQLPEP